MSRLLTLWNRASHIGVARDQSSRQQRRIVAINQALTAGVTATAVYGAVYVAFGYWIPLAVNVLAAALYASALNANRAGRWRLARHVGYLTANAHMFVSVDVFFTGATGIHYWYWLFVILYFLSFPPEERLAMALYTGLSGALFVVVEYGLFPLGPTIVLDEVVAKALHATSIFSTLAIITLIVSFFSRQSIRAEEALEREHQRSEELLLNILPPSIAQRLKDQPGSIADSFPAVTVLFADIAGFTPLSASLPPHAIVDMLNQLFSEFDRIADDHGVEKIKTIGDAYMAAAGLPEPMADHAAAVVDMALGMKEIAARYRTPDGAPFRARIGVNTGPVVAGVIGSKKFIYDLWGDTVNTASRMESSGVVGEVQVSEATWRACADRFLFECRGPIEVKGKGTMVTYLVKGRR